MCIFIFFFFFYSCFSLFFCFFFFQAEDGIRDLVRSRGLGDVYKRQALMMKFAEMSAKYFPSREIIEYSYDGKQDAPSGTARELASRIAKIKSAENKIIPEDTIGLIESRGANIAGTQIHSVRLPGFNSSCEIIFGTGAERLKIRHDAIDATKPYIDGALLALRKVRSLTGLHRGMDSIINL